MSDHYSALLRHPKWFRKRAQVLRRDGQKCRNCGKKSDLNVHHKQYHADKSSGKLKKPWNYKLKYLVTLCNDCHRKGHDCFKIPTFKI